jgi:hypothetical protein
MLVLLESLSPEQRAVLLLHDVFDYGYPRIAALDIADGEIKSIGSVANPDKLRHLGPVGNLGTVLRSAG